MKKELQNAREDYRQEVLEISSVDKDPLKQFKIWLKEYQKIRIRDFNAMVLSTVNDNKPTSRVVLLKGIDKGGLEFYTNYTSNKGKEIAANPHVSLNFYWPELERQVRVDGRAEKLTVVESDEYFATRPEDSKIGAWASDQSSEIKSRLELEEKVKEYGKKFQNDIPRPASWGGYRVMPVYFEFWQGRLSRLHDRIVYEQHKEDGEWQLKRLAP